MQTVDFMPSTSTVQSSFFGIDRRNTLVAFKDAISESGRKLSLMVSENQQRALESLLADIQGAQMSPRRKALYSLFFFIFLVALYWFGLVLVESLLTLRDTMTGRLQYETLYDTTEHFNIVSGHLDRMSAAHSSQLYEVNKRLEAVEMLLSNMQTREVSDKLETVLGLVKESAEGNTYVYCYKSFLIMIILSQLKNDSNGQTSC